MKGAPLCVPGEKHNFSMHQAAGRQQRRDEGPKRCRAKLALHDVDHHGCPDDGGENVALPKGTNCHEGRAQGPRCVRTGTHSTGCVRSSFHKRTVDHETFLADGSSKVAGDLLNPVKEPWHQCYQERGPMPWWHGFQSFHTNYKANIQDDGVEDLCWEDGQHQARETGEADHDERNTGHRGISDLRPHRFECSMSDKHSHSPRRAEEARDDRGHAIADHRPSKVVVVPCVRSHLADLDRSDRNGESQRNRDA
mmetsp:Transcript_47573/g.101785  ORF Transcript_47573/g.101785 Transcript_47573/m.101785 type:complete len:252 (-) Transcript_47573:945-1700(-)